MIGREIGRYRVVARLGQGGIAIVWKADDHLLGRTVALKILDEKLALSPKPRRRFLHEAQAAAALDHPGIIAVHDYGETDGFVYIALSLVDGETLSEYAARRLPPIDDAVRIAASAAEALGHAHTRGVTHRDVTGRNIMIARDGRVILLDFGLALAAWESRVTTTEVAMGTVPYMAPEVIQAKPADARSDLYGLGVVLYEALTGAFPFPGEQAQAVFFGATHLDPVPPRQRRPEVPPALESVVLKLLARDPAARYQTAADVVAALGAIDLPDASDVAHRRDAPGTDLPQWASPDAPTISLSGAAATPLYLAVLPFELVESSADPDHACATLARRLAETVSCAVARSPRVRVVPPPTANLPAEPREAARQLGANVLLRGSVRRAGSQVRVSYALLDPWSGVQLGGDVVDGSALQIFDIEDQVLASLRRTLHIPGNADERESRPPDPAAHEHYRQALGYLRRYDNDASVDGAIALLERLVGSEGNSVIYHAALARAYLHKHQLTRERVWENRAAAACQRAVSLDPDAADVRLAVGFLKLNAGRHAAALGDFETVLQRDPRSFDARLGMGRALADSGDLPAAERCCVEAVAEHPEDWRGHSLLGWVRFRQKRFAEALGPWQRVVELTPDNARGRRNLGSALYRLDRHQEAVNAYNESLAIQPNDEAYSNLGAALYVLERYEEAIAAFRTAVTLTTSDPLRWGNLGIACRWVPGHEHESAVPLERAIGLMRERLERNPSRADWWALLAGWLADCGRLDEALETIRHAIELDPEDVECMLRAGHIYFQLGQRKEALKWFRKARYAGCGVGELRHSPALAALREDPEFVRLLDSGPEAKSEGDVPEPDARA